MRSTARAKAAVSSTSTSTAHGCCSMASTSRKTSRSFATTGTPDCAASTAASPNVSADDGNTNTSNAPRKSAIRPGDNSPDEVNDDHGRRTTWRASMSSCRRGALAGQREMPVASRQQPDRGVQVLRRGEAARRFRAASRPGQRQESRACRLPSCCRLGLEPMIDPHQRGCDRPPDNARTRSRPTRIHHEAVKQPGTGRSASSRPRTQAGTSDRAEFRLMITAFTPASLAASAPTTLP